MDEGDKIRLLHEMDKISNKSNLTLSTAKILTSRLTDDEIQIFKQWLTIVENNLQEKYDKGYDEGYDSGFRDGREEY